MAVREGAAMPRMAETKFSRPQLAGELIHDEQRLAALDRAPDYTLSLVCAPAGFGKTTLVAQWLESRKPAHVWLTLEARDNEPSVFWQGVRHALAGLDRRFEMSAAAPMAEFGSRDKHDPVDALINILADYARTWQAPPQVFLVLDDFHVITHPDVLAQLRRLFEFAPPLLRVIMTTRAEPTLGLAQMLVRNQVLHLHMEALRFDYELTRQFLTRRLGTEISAEQVRVLHKRTSGWPALLQLATLAGGLTGSVAHTLERFGGSDHMLSEYLMTEVYGQLPEDVREFLSEIARLPVFNGDLADEVRQRGDSSELIARIREHQLLVQDLGSEGQWYRLHDLLRDWLLAHPPPPQRREELSRRAAAALARAGQVTEALELYLETGDYLAAEALLPRAVEQWLKAGTLRVQHAVVERFPESMQRSSPALGIMRAGLLFLSGRYRETLDTLDRYHAMLMQDASPGESRLPYLALFMRCHSAGFCGDQATARALVREMEGHLGEGSPWLRAWILFSLGMDAMVESELGDAEYYLSQAQELAARCEDRHCGARVLTLRIPVLVNMGEVSRGWEVFRRFERDFAELPLARGEEALLSYVHAILCVESDQLGEAADSLQRALTLGEDCLAPGDHTGILFERWRVAMGRKHWETAAQLIESLEQCYRRRGGAWDYFVPEPDALRALLALRQSNMMPLILWAQQERDDEGRSRFRRLHEEMLALTAGVLEGRCDIDDIRAFREVVRAGENRQIQGRLHVLEALALWYREQDEEAAARALAWPLETLYPQGARYFFRADGQKLAPLFAVCQRIGVAPESAEEVLALLNGRHADPPKESAEPTPAADTGLIEEISRREQEVLRLLNDGKTNREMAEVLGIAPATIKAHLRNIYGKLGVTNRAGAVSRAHGYGLLGD